MTDNKKEMNKLIDKLLLKKWLEEKDETFARRCPTVFKVSGHRCYGVYGHPASCQDIDYTEPSKDLELVP